MDADREKQVAGIKQRVREGTYRVDPKLVAEAIIRHLREDPARASAHNPQVVRSSR